MTPNTPAVDLDEIAGRVPANYTGAGHFGILISTAERDELVRLARLARVSTLPDDKGLRKILAEEARLTSEHGSRSIIFRNGGNVTIGSDVALSAIRRVAATRLAALEEAAKVCNATAEIFDNDWNRRLGVANDLKEACVECARAIRSLIQKEEKGNG